MSVGKAPPCVPTWRGHVETTKDALLIFEGCFQGTLAHCFRRPHDRERADLIVSGNVFVYEEATSGIKRWTDGIPWSPSRILTNFLIYRQLNSPFPPGEKKRATKRSQRVHKPGEPYPTPAPSTVAKDEYSSSFSPESPGLKSDEGADKDGDRGLVGSLVDSYEFKEKGLLKKTMTVTIKGVQHHLVSYYSLEDAKHKLKTPRDDDQIRHMSLRPELVNQPKFKSQNLDDAGDGTYDHSDPSSQTFSYLPPTIDASRSYSIPHHGHGAFLEGSQQYYYPPLVSQAWNYPPHTHNGIAYGTMPAASSVHTATASSSPYQNGAGHIMGTQYSPQISQNHVHPPLQLQPHHIPQHQQRHVLSPRSQQMQTANYPHYPSSATLPRPVGTMDNGPISHNTHGSHHSTYENYHSTTTPMNSTMAYAGGHQMPVGYVNAVPSYAVKSEGTPQPYRAY
ncbi:Global transcription regulator sge1 [Xanthoria parietina]